MPPNDQNQKPPSPTPDTSQYLLPKKEIHDPTNAPRVSAGTLLQQEQAATLPKVSAPPMPTAPKNDSIVQPLVTYQSDMQKYIQSNRVSEVTIAAAEAKRRGEKGASEESATSESLGGFSFRILMIFLGALLLGSAIGLVGYMVYRMQTIAPPAAIQAPVILIDEAYSVEIKPEASHTAVITALQQAKDSVALSLGLVAQLVPAAATTTGDKQQTVLPAQTFFMQIAPNMPQALTRTLLPTFLLGVHAYDGNQALLILKTDSYEQAFSGMLAWERTMRDDLLPLFAYTPPARITEGVALATTTLTSTSTLAATSTQAQATSTATTTPEAAPSAFLQTGFIDKIVENHDARVFQNSFGDVYFLWTFLDRGTIVITTNPSTLKEIILRTHEAPIVPIPGQ